MLKRRFNMEMDEEGVSEVLGTILTLLITVALFGSVFATVTQMEGPEGDLNVELDAYYKYQEGEDSVIIIHEGGQSLDTDSLGFFLLVDDQSYHESPVEEDPSWSVGKERTLIGDWNIESDSTVELMIREDDTNRLVYQTMLLEDRNIIDIRNPRIEYKHDWRNYAEPNENITIKTEVAAPIWKSYESFDLEDIWVNASIYEDDILVEKDGGSSITAHETIELDHSHNARFERELQIDVAADDDRYRIKITVEHQEKDLSVDPAYLFLNIGKEPVQYYEEDLVIGKLWFEPGSPSHGDDFTIYAEVFNEGEADQDAEWTIKDDRQGEFDSAQPTTISRGAAPTLITARYPDGIEGHGPHEITFEIDPIDDEWDGDEWKDTVYVDPNIMLVRDHIHEDLREGELMENALKGLNLDYDTYTVEPDEKIDRLDETLVQYSVTIWMTGNETEESPYLANEDVLRELTNYIEGDLEGCVTNGTLWLIGSNIDKINFGDLDDKLGVEDFGNRVSIEEKSKLMNPVSDENGTYSDFEYGIAEGEYLNISELKENVKENNTLVEQGISYPYFGVGYEGVEKERTAVNSFLFESIADPGQQTIMAGEVIQWLSNMTTRTGVDIAVTSQRIEPTAPMFMDEVRINARLRNNGPDDLHVAVRAVRNRGEEILSPEGNDQVFLPANGGTNTTTFTWVADELGRHEFIVKADYFNEIDEVTRENNDITYKDLDVTDDNIEVNVHFSTLLVDADGSGYSNNYNVTEEVQKSFDRLGHEEGVDYDYYYVGEDEDGPRHEGMMENYNAIFWVTGENQEIVTGEIRDYLEQDDGANVIFMGEHILDQVYDDALLEKMGIDNVGDRVETDVLMGQKNNNLGHGLRYKVEAKEYNTFESNEQGEVLFKCEEGEHNFASTYDDGSTKTIYMGINPNRIEEPFLKDGAFDNWPTGEVQNTRENAREEFIYTSLWYFGKRDDRAELRVTDYDIRSSSEHPHTGRSYQLDARIENIGYRSASALIRFKDGRNHVASQTVQVEGSSRTSKPGSSHFEVSPGSTTAEVSWTPTHGGIRSIKVRVDPIGRTDEIEDDDGEKVMEFNNEAILDHPVYYFYDDMEDGTDYWERQATIAHIDGEAPIDYLGDYDGLDTDVIGDWDETKGVEKVSDHARSDPNSFFMEEPVGKIGREADTIVSIVIDNSHYMAHGQHGWEFEDELWVKHATQAAKHLVNQLSNESMVGLWAFSEYFGDDGKAVQVREPLLLDDHEEEILGVIDAIGGDEDAIDEWDLEEYGFDEGSPKTYMWDATGGAYSDVMDTREEDPHAATLEPAVVSLGAGADKGASLHSGQPSQWETGSQEWAPWHKMEDDDGTPIIDYEEDYGYRYGKYRFTEEYEDEPGEWSIVGDHPGGDFEIGSRKGLLDAPIPIFTIGLGLEHNDDIDENPDDPDWNPSDDWPPGDEHYLYIHDDPDYKPAWEAGTMEYNLWRIATTSDAEYFYAPDPGDLDDIFAQIGDLISGPQNLTSIGDPTPLDTSSNELTSDGYIGNNHDKYAVTPELDLRNTSSAWLTFWHRYRLLQGVNGAYIQIGYEENGDMNWRYIKPSIGPYTGNLLEGDQDSFGNNIEWAWNGKSAEGTMNWERVRIDLLRDDYDIPEEALDSVQVRFYYKQFGGSTVPGGWWIDDIRVDVTRSGDWWDDDIESDINDVWQLKETEDMDGKTTTAWWNGNLETGYFKPGIDNSLITDPIDIRNAQSVTLKAEFKFNINEDHGLPPDGFRVEVSEDGGKSWSSINLGGRAATGVSGDEDNSHNWTKAEDLTRLNIDLSDYSGEIILLRFRVVTNNDGNYEKYEEELDFGGLYINNVMVVDDELRD